MSAFETHQSEVADAFPLKFDDNLSNLGAFTYEDFKGWISYNDIPFVVSAS